MRLVSNFSPDGRFLLVSGPNVQCRLWEVQGWGVHRAWTDELRG